jgi:ATP-dependent helicase HrpB
MAAHPRLARLVWEGVRRGVLAETALAAALLSERDPFPRHALRARLSDSDVYDRVRALQAWDAGHGGGWLGSPNPAGAQAVLRTAELLERDVARLRIAVLNDEDPVDVAFGRALLAAWPDRLAVRREAGSRRGVAVGGRGVTLAEESGVVDAELFLCVDVDAGRRGERAEAVVRQASRVEREWLDPDLIRVTHTGGWDEASGRVVALRRTSFLDLVLEEVQTGVPDAEACAQALAAAARRDPARVLPLAEEDVVQLRARVACLREWLPELELPLLDEAKILADIESFVWGARSIDEVLKRDLAAHLKAQLSAEHQRALDRDAPERIEIPTGSRIRLVYEPGRTPILAARIQELFGMKETPRLARGRAKVVMHLLAPNYRPQQVTDDLASFWSNAYHEVKKELKRRYPKHAWPDDPLTAPPQRKGPSQRS